MKLILSLFLFIFFISSGVFAQEKSCCSGDQVKKEVTIEKSINKDNKTVEIKETVVKDGKTVEVKKVINEEKSKDGCCASSKDKSEMNSEVKKDCTTKDITEKKSDCCKSDVKVEKKVEKEIK
ncbi:MAG: hypothetical protein LDL01_02900 [Ignavibacterium sp.]|jgi:hypothetical protein|uniref:Uncharacterized protein n=1 Tax=Ignavibacterium album TaxID=591197 RepID=A0A7V2ZJ42_9BACT|nr:hypothetical protein [Ignavibacterium sp.]